MLRSNLEEINELNKMIEKALEDSNFIELASLSTKLKHTIEAFVTNTDYKKDIDKIELNTLKNLLARVDEYQKETDKKFKDYTLRISKQTKMQNAYNQSRR